MGNLSALAAAELVRVYDVSSVSTVVDVGGAHGILLAAILDANPAARGILFDLPHVIETARSAVEARGLEGRCELASGDFFEAVPDGGDAYLLKFILHDWDDERSVAILNNCRRAMRPGGRVLVVELLLPPGNAPSFAKTQDVNMLINLGGRERTAAEYAALLAAAVFLLTRVIPAQGELHVIEGTPA